MKHDIDKWRDFLTEQLGDNNEPTEFRTLAGRTLEVDDGGKNIFDVEFCCDGSFQRIVSYITVKRIGK